MAEFFVQGRPAGQGSKRYLGRGVMVEQSKYVKPWRTDVREEARGHFRSPLTAAVRITLQFHFPRPAVHFKRNGEESASWRPYRTTAPDLDKMIRSTLDALTGIAYVDDRQVIEICAKKLWVAPDDLQGCRIRVEERL